MSDQFIGSPLAVGASGHEQPVSIFNSSPEVIRLVAMMYVRYPLPLRNVEDLLAERGIDISHETDRFWRDRFGPVFALTRPSIRMTLSLASLSPTLVKAAIDGRLPRGFGAKRLMDLPMTWSDQWMALGLRAPAQA